MPTFWLSSIPKGGPATALTILASMEAFQDYSARMREHYHRDYSTRVKADELQFLFDGIPALDSHDHKDERATAWAVGLIGKLGDRSDLGTLRILLNQPDFARSATGAIRQIEMRC
ncbi:hypothetical protein [Rhizobium azibense]|uniref:Uncharacterized protein n=1 Tax=Rhizobium azibense TaxID=1136135 RepID=A0A4R3R1J6_9HYPH|nr:hypothetical protein [Rhizobium azibense]TCU28810.1 hypothetical protein EV129_1346 [Rhizobium azibense]